MKKNKFFSTIISIMMVMSIILNCIPCLISNQVSAAAEYETVIWPVPGCYKINSRYGWRDLDGNGTNEDLHHAIDIKCSVGTDVVAVASGKVVLVQTGYNLGMGNRIVVDHGNSIFTGYQHLNQILVNKGDIVYQGQVIAKSGNTGDSGGPHLDFHVKINGDDVLSPVTNHFNVNPLDNFLPYDGQVSTNGETVYIKSTAYTLPKYNTGPPVSNLQLTYPSGKGAPSGNLKQGSSFGIYGTITNGIPIRKVWGGVYKTTWLDLPISEAMGFEVTPNTTTYSLYPDIDNKIIFNKLEPGEYRWLVYAADDENSKVKLADSCFTIVGDAPPVIESNITIANATKPTGTLKQGSNFGVYGNISSNLPIQKVWGGVYNSSGSATAQYAEATPKTTTYDLHGYFNDKIIFNNLPAGNYTYKIEANDGQKSYVLVNSSFTVGSVDSNSSMSISGETKPTGSLKQGSFFGIYGDITSTLNITKIWGGVYQSDGSTKTTQYYEVAPNAKTYSLYPTFDNKIIFNYLSVGNYVYKIQATDTSGKTYTLINSSFSIVSPDSGSNMSIKNHTVPSGTLQQGNFFGIYGDITSALNITKVWGGVYNRGGSATAQYAEAAPNSKTYSLYPHFDNNIIFNNLPVGYYTYKIQATDTSGKTYTLINSDFQIGNPQGTMTFTSSATSLTLNRSKGESKVITFTVKNNTERIHLNVVHGSTTLTSASPGSWSGDDMPITFTGKADGTETLEVQVRNESDKVLATIKVKITVTSDPFEFNSTATSLNISGAVTKQITFSYKNYDGKVSIQWEHGSDRATTLEWGEWSNSTIPLSITGKGNGTEKLIVYLKDTETDKVIDMKTITVTVSGIPTKLNVSSNSVSVNMDNAETKSVTFSYSGIPATTHTMNVRWIHGDNIATSLSWNSWENHTRDLKITGYRTGTEKVIVELYDTDTQETLASQIIEVTVTGTPKISASSNAISLDYNNPSSKNVKFTMTNIPYGSSIQALHGDNVVCTYSWLGWDDGTNTLSVTPTAPGTEVVTVNLLSSDDRVIVSAKVTITVTAKFNVTFDANGGTVEVASKTVTYNQKYGDLPKPTKTGHLFDGWYTEETGGILIDEDSIVSLIGDQTIFAHWTLNSYTITLDSTGGDIESDTITATYSKPYGYLPTPVKSGYEFLGWYTAETGGTHITGQTIVETNKNHTLYAQWERIPETTTTTTTTTTTATTTTTISTNTTTTTTSLTTDTSTEITTTTTETTTEPIETLPPEDVPQIVVGTVNGKPGEVVEVNIELRNNPGILATGFEIVYDTTQLKLLEVLNGELMSGKILQSDEDLTSMPYAVSWSDVGGVVKSDGVLVVLRFEISEDTSDLLLPITLHCNQNQTFDNNLENVILAVVDGVVEVNNASDGLPGDVNKDGLVDLKDVVLIRRYIVGGWDVTIDADLADVNSDDFVDLKDVVLIRRFIAGGWDVDLGLKP